MRNTFSVNFYVRNCKTTKNGEAPLEIAIGINGKRLFMNLPYKVRPEDFKKKRKPKELQAYMDLMRVRVNEILLEMTAHQEPITTERLLSYFRTGGYKSYTINNLFNDYLEILYKRVPSTLSHGVYRKYELVRDIFFQYVNKDSECDTITNATIKTVQSDLLNRYDTSTAAGYLTKLKAFITFGMDNDKIKINPFSNIKIQRGTKPIKFLTNEEIQKIMDYQPENDSMQRVKDCALFQISSGLAYCDCVTLEPDDMKEVNGINYINKRRHKTGTEFTAVVLPFGVEVWNKYNGKIPFISNQKFNLFLKVLQERTGIKTTLHTHLFRHTTAQLLLSSGVRLETVSRMLGHKNTKITQSFYCNIQKEDTIKEVAAIMYA